jgi:ribosomal protein L21E
MLLKLETIDKTNGSVCSRWWEDADPVEAEIRWEKHFTHSNVRITPCKDYPTKFKIGQRVRMTAERSIENETMNPATCGKIGTVISCFEDDDCGQGASYLVQFTDDITVDGEQWTWDFAADLPIGQSMLYDSEIEGLVPVQGETCHCSKKRMFTTITKVTFISLEKTDGKTVVVNLDDVLAFEDRIDYKVVCMRSRDRGVNLAYIVKPGANEIMATIRKALA